MKTPLVHIIRHGEALHNIERGYPHRDPPLTESGQDATKAIKVPVEPGLIIISPMTRTIQTAMNAFPFLQGPGPFPVEVQVWPDLREANDAICNKGLSQSEMQAKFPQFDFSQCLEEWNYLPHTIEDATARAETVRQRLKDLSAKYKNIVLVTHRGFIAFLVKGRRFNMCEIRSYRFATDEEMKNPKAGLGLNCDTLQEQDFGPTMLVLHSTREEDASDIELPHLEKHV